MKTLLLILLTSIGLAFTLSLGFIALINWLLPEDEETT